MTSIISEEDRLGQLAGNDVNRLDARVVLLTHYIPEHQIDIYRCLAKRIRDFRVLLSTSIEANRHFQPDWRGVDVVVQKTWTFHQRWRHDVGFDDRLFVHVPYDTWHQLDRFRPDVILSYELGARSLASAFYRRMKRDCRLILCTFMSTHTEKGRGWMREALRRRLIRQADALTYNSQNCRELLIKYGAPDASLYQFPYAANSLFTEQPTPNFANTADRCLLYVGQISDRKGVARMLDQLADAARKRAEHKIKLTLAGEGPLRSELQSRSYPQNLELNWLGHVSLENLPELMHKHSALILPTLADEWAVVVNEALHCGLPVIGSCLAQACLSLIEPGRNGWRYDPRKPNDLEAVIEQFYQRDARILSEMRQHALQTVSDRTPAWAADAVLQACRQVLTTREPRKY